MVAQYIEIFLVMVRRELQVEESVSRVPHTEESWHDAR